MVLMACYTTFCIIFFHIPLTIGVWCYPIIPWGLFTDLIAPTLVVRVPFMSAELTWEGFNMVRVPWGREGWELKSYHH